MKTNAPSLLRGAITFALLGFWTSCGNSATSDSPWDHLKSYADEFPPACAALSSLVAFVYQHKACTADSDCVHVQSCLAAKDIYQGGFYVNKQYDPGQMQTLLAAASACPVNEPCGATIPYPPACGHNRCYAAASVEGSAECLSLIGDAGDCSLCLCMEGSANATACLYDAKCAPIFRCAKQAGCYGTLACDLAAPGFPCKDEVDAAGGPTSATAALYRLSNARAPRLGCDVPCAAK